MNKIAGVAYACILFTPGISAEILCEPHESVSFACAFKSKSVSVCRTTQDTLIYRFGSPQKIELELESEIHFSRTAYSGGGEGNLRFTNADYSYVVYSSISNGAWLENGTREKIERAGVYVVKGDKLLNDIECQSFSGKHYIDNLPAFEPKEFRYYQ